MENKDVENGRVRLRLVLFQKNWQLFFSFSWSSKVGNAVDVTAFVPPRSAFVAR
jgi:hypothetical protein